VISKKEIAGTLSSLLRNPAFSRAFSTFWIMFFSQACSSCPWKMARMAWSFRGANWAPQREASFNTSPSPMPDSMSGSSTSACHQSLSVSAMRRRLSP
jgi:hypothetical protein